MVKILSPVFIETRMGTKLTSYNKAAGFVGERLAVGIFAKNAVHFPKKLWKVLLLLIRKLAQYKVLAIRPVSNFVAYANAYAAKPITNMLYERLDSVMPSI